MDHGPQPLAAQTHSQPDSRRRLSFVEWGGIDGGDQNIPADRASHETVERGQGDLRLEPAVRNHLIRLQAQIVGHFGDRLEIRKPGDIEVSH